MFKTLLFTLFVGAGFLGATDVTFNDYPNKDTQGDRSNKDMLTRPAIGGMLRCRDAGVPAQEYNHFFGPGQYSYDDRKKLGYYWNPGIQEFGAVNSSANVTAAYIWGHGYISAGQDGTLRTVSGAIKMFLDTTADLEPTWDMAGLLIGNDNYNTLPFLSALDTCRPEGYGWDGPWKFATVTAALGDGMAFNVTKSVKYIMDHPAEKDLGIIVRSDSAAGQLSIAAEELNTTNTGYKLLLTIVYNGTPNTATETRKAAASPALQLFQNSPNPCVSGTAICFSVPASQQAEVTVYSADGKLVKTLLNGRVNGTHQVHWDNRDNRGLKVKSGIYFYKLSVPNRTLTRKMIIVE